MNMEVRMKKRCLSLVCVMVLLLSLSGVNVYASEERVMVDGSYLTHDDEAVGEAVLVTRGDDLQAGTSKVSKASITFGPGSIKRQSSISADELRLKPSSYLCKVIFQSAAPVPK